MTNSSRGLLTERAVLLILLLLGFSLRVWQISNVGLDHFDEGVYVFSALGLSDPSQPHQLYPEQVKFSPPLYFSLVALAYHVFGGPLDTIAILVNVFLGTLTIGAVWLVARAWFGGQAGIVAAALLTFSEFHIALSRAALTDVAFVFFFVLALGATAIALERKSVVWAVLAGVVIGIAWNTKYHGWFVLLIAGMALLPQVWMARTRGASPMRLLLLYGIIALVAGICSLPWALFVQSQPGGYPALLEYQRTLIDGHWRTNLGWQTQMQLFLEGPSTRASIPIAFFCALLVSPTSLRSGSKFIMILFLLSAGALIIGGAGTAVLLTLIALPTLLRRLNMLTTWLMLSWLAVWFFSAPLYHPYARLVLPFTIATYFVAGFWISAIVNEPQHAVGRIPWQSAVAAIGVALVSVIAVVMPHASDPWMPSRSVPEAVARMSAIIAPGSRVIVIGEPPTAFYLHLSGRPAFERVEDPSAWQSVPTPVYLVTGVYAKWSPVLRDGLEALGSRLVPLGTFQMNPNDIRLLDDLAPNEARLFRTHPDNTFDLTLYYLLPMQQAP